MFMNSLLISLFSKQTPKKKHKQEQESILEENEEMSEVASIILNYSVAYDTSVGDLILQSNRV
jgi:hypothetical protein